jgi:surfeit locus 1 family protein
MKTQPWPGWLRALFLAAIPVVVLGMVALGIWQLGRLQERRSRNAAIAARLAEPAVWVEPALFVGDLAQLDYRPGQARGTFDPVQEIVWRNQARNGAPGVHVITPLRLAEGDAAVLVDRGWIPYTQAEPAARGVYLAPDGVMTISGVLRLPNRRTADFLPVDPPLGPDRPRVDAWFWLDVAQIQAQVPYPLLPLILVQTDRPAAEQLPVPNFVLDLSDGPHLAYAIQWFAFAAIAGFGPLLYWRHSRRRPGG